ncbi:MAG: peptidylprolyl isomerase [Patescibacteria group bacterium]
MSIVQKRWALGIGCGVFVLWLFLQMSAIFFHVGDGVMRYVSRFVLPPAWIAFSPVSYHRVVETAHAFVALAIAPTYQEAFPLALGFVLRDIRTEDLLGDIEVSEEEIFSDADSAIFLAEGISEKEQQKYIEDSLLRARAAELLRNNMLPSQEMRLQNVLEKIELGMPFADIARYFSEDSSAMNGGDLGVFLVSELPAWAQDIAIMEIDEVRSDFVGADAFWVLKVVDTGGEDSEAWVQIRGVAINKPTLGAVLRAHAAEHPAWIFVW